MPKEHQNVVVVASSTNADEEMAMNCTEQIQKGIIHINGQCNLIIQADRTVGIWTEIDYGLYDVVTNTLKIDSP